MPVNGDEIIDSVMTRTKKKVKIYVFYIRILLKYNFIDS